MSTLPGEARSHWAVGQVVLHLRFGYRGVIADVDSDFQGTEEWYQHVAQSRPPRDRPWYHVLVHGSDHTTYVAERHLALDPSGDPVDHPLVESLFESFSEGVYRPVQLVH